MRRTLRHLLVGISATTLLTACIFTVDTDMASTDEVDAGDSDTGLPDTDLPDADPVDVPPSDPDTGPDDTGPDDTGPDDTGPDDTGPDDTGPDDTGPDDADTTPVPRSVDIVDPDSEITVPSAEFVIEYEFECEPEGCEDHLQCRVFQADDDPEFEPCGLIYEITDNDVSEGVHTLEVEIRSEDGEDILASDEHTTTVFIDFEASIDLNSDEVNEFSHPYLGERLVTCTHPHCEIACQWEDDDLSPGEDSGVCDHDGELEFNQYFEIPEDTDETTLYFKACSATDFGDDEHCVETSYDFEYVDPSWQQVSAGNRHTCGILDDQSLWCWGSDSIVGPEGNVTGILGIGEAANEIEYRPRHVTAEVDIDLRWKEVAAGYAHTCAISEHDELYCWGFNSAGEVAPGDSDSTFGTPTLLDDEHTWQTVTSGGLVSCAITDEDALYCWGGENYEYKLGSGDDPDLDELNLVPAENYVGFEGADQYIEIEGWLDVDLGFDHGCAIAENSEGANEWFGAALVYCWGDSEHGQVARSSEGPYFTPQLVTDGSDELDPNAFTTHTSIDVTTGHNHTCAVAEDTSEETQAYCWGHDGNGRLGRGEGAPEETHLPGFVHGSSGYSTITAGSRHTCAIDEAHRPMCWGANTRGQTGTTNDPEDVGDITTPRGVDFTAVGEPSFQSISADGDHTCAISDDSDNNTLYCWGDNQFGAVGVGPSQQTFTPLPVEWPYAP